MQMASPRCARRIKQRLIPAVSSSLTKPESRRIWCRCAAGAPGARDFTPRFLRAIGRSKFSQPDHAIFSTAEHDLADEIYLKIAGRMVYLWRAVNSEGEVLDVLIQSRRNKRAALKLMRKLLKKYGFVTRHR